MSQVRSLLAGVMLALACVNAAAAGLPAVVSADQEAEAANPGRSERRAAHLPHRHEAGFRATMDRVFGEGRWRQTSGFRTVAQENALRRAGAGTVAPGHLSRHSLGAPDAPGAYDAVVDGLGTAAAAARLKASGAEFARVLAEGRHGPEGPHLHIELTSAQAGGAE